MIIDQEVRSNRSAMSTENALESESLARRLWRVAAQYVTGNRYRRCRVSHCAPPSGLFSFDSCASSIGSVHEEDGCRAENSGEGYKELRVLGCGAFGMVYLMKEEATGEHVAVKFLRRGRGINENAKREIFNHRRLSHPNIIGFRKAFLTDADLGIVLDNADDGTLFRRLDDSGGRFHEDEARYFFQQLIAGVEFMHKSKIVHRDIKLENLLLHKSPELKLKIVDFGYSKSGEDSRPNSSVGTRCYQAPEVIRNPNVTEQPEYNGEMVDVWSCGVVLFLMLVGRYPFGDPHPRSSHGYDEIRQRITNVDFKFPSHVKISRNCKQLIKKIFVADPEKRITIQKLKEHSWFKKNLPKELFEPHLPAVRSYQTTEQLEDILQKAQTVLPLGNDYLDNIDFEHVGDEVDERCGGLLEGQ